jgi:hypothetical protein
MMLGADLVAQIQTFFRQAFLGSTSSSEKAFFRRSSKCSTPSIRLRRMIGRKQPDSNPSSAFTLSATGASDFGALPKRTAFPV